MDGAGHRHSAARLYRFSVQCTDVCSPAFSPMALSLDIKIGGSFWSAHAKLNAIGLKLGLRTVHAIATRSKQAVTSEVSRPLRRAALFRKAFAAFFYALADLFI